MITKHGIDLSRRQEEILDIIIRLREASVRDIIENLSESPTDGAVRRMLNILSQKGVVEYYHDGARKVYKPTINTATARKKALQHIVDTFFAGSAVKAIASLINSSDIDLLEEEKQILADLIKKANNKGR